MKKIALINQRYGLEVNGGSETYTRQIAEKLSENFEVEILTTKALSYDQWENYYEQDEEIIDGIKVFRFDVKRKRNNFGQNLAGRLLRHGFSKSKMLGEIWINCQGPYAPGLIQFIRNHRSDYDLFVFVTYLYYTTVMGIKEVAEKSILIPTAHDEYCVYFPCYKDIFMMPKGIVYLTEEEKRFVQKTFKNEGIPNIVAGIGIDIPKDINSDRFRDKYQIDGEYLIYAGRIDWNKNCHEMFEMFEHLLMEQWMDNQSLTLVVIGQKHMNIPQNEHIKYLGFVSEEDKFDGIKGAKALWLPSQNESLSISVLEAMALGVPVIVNGKCAVLKGHCEKSQGGCFYFDEQDFKEKIIAFFGKNWEEMSRNEIAYIQNNYNWKRIIEDLTFYFNRIIDKKNGSGE